MATDEEMIRQFEKSHDRKILNELMQRHVGKVRAIIFRMVHNQADVDDLTQEVFVKVLQGMPGFKKNARFSTWLYRITVNVVYSFLTQKKKSRCKLYGDLPEKTDTKMGMAEEVETKTELNLQLSIALAALTPKLKSALMASVDKSEAMATENCSRATMYWRIHQARQIVRERMNRSTNRTEVTLGNHSV